MTTQIPDVLMFKGKRYAIDHTPLESAWAENDPLKPKFDFRVTSNWRGYVATWRIEDEGENPASTDLRLVLCGLAGATVDGVPVTHLDVLGYDGDDDAYPDSDEVVADWFSGAINAGRGDLLYSKPMLTTRTLYSEMLHLQVHRGKVLNLREAQYTEEDIKRFFPAAPPVNENELPYFSRRIPAETSQTEEAEIEQRDTPQIQASNADLKQMCRQTVMNGGTLAQFLENILCNDGRSYVFAEVSDWQGCLCAAISVGYCKLVLLERQGAKFIVENASGEFVITALEFSQPRGEQSNTATSLLEALNFPKTAETYFNAIRDVLLTSGTDKEANFRFANSLFKQIERFPDTNKISDSFYEFIGEWVCDTWDDVDMPMMRSIDEKPQTSSSAVECKTEEQQTSSTPVLPTAKSEQGKIRFIEGKKRPTVGFASTIGAMFTGGNPKVLSNSVAFHAHRLQSVFALVDFYSRWLHRYSVRGDDIGFKAKVALRAIEKELIFDLGDFATLILWVEAAPPKSSWDWARDTFREKMSKYLTDFGVDSSSPLTN